MSQILAPFKSLLANHKLKMLGVLVFAVIFAVWIFPSGDLSDLASDRVTRATGVYTQFDGLGLVFGPGPGIHAENLVVEPPALPAVKVQGANVFVSLLDLIVGKQAGSAQLAGLFKGDVSVDFSEGDKLKSGERSKNVTVTTNKLSLEDVSDYLRNANLAGLALHGALSMDSSFKVDPNFAEQPSGTVGLNIINFSMPAQTLQTQMGPLQTSPLQLGKVVVQAEMKDGQVELKDVSFGGAKDGIAGKVRGQIQVRMMKVGMNVTPLVTNYKLAFDLTVPKVFLAGNPTMGMAFTLLDGMVGRFKKEGDAEVKYNFAASGIPGAVPNFTDKL